jgi:hypothetical protein
MQKTGGTDEVLALGLRSIAPAYVGPVSESILRGTGTDARNTRT